MSTMFNHLSSLRSDATAVEALYALGHSLLLQEQFADAASVFRILLQVAPGDDRSWLALGECHRQAGHTEIALELFSAGTVAVESARGCAVARFRLLHDLGRSDDADTAFDEALVIAERDADHDFLSSLRNERALRP
jgi:Flp pilus assembly protein TadD